MISRRRVILQCLLVRRAQSDQRDSYTQYVSLQYRQRCDRSTTGRAAGMASPELEVSQFISIQLPLIFSTNSPGSQALHSVHPFTEHSIYHSCQVYEATGQPAVPEAYTIQANGASITCKTVTQNLVYTPAPLLVDSMFTKATFSSDFTELLNVTFNLVPEVQQALTVINFDSHTYTALLKV